VPGPGHPTVFAADEQADEPVDVVRYARLVEDALAAQGVGGDLEVSLLFVDVGTISDLNQQFMELEGPTDVLSFPIDDDLTEPGRFPDGGTAGPDREPGDPDDLPLLLGDIVICPAVAKVNAPEHAGTFADELALLVVHGVLHLLGHDHADEAPRAAMWERERAILDQCWGPLAGDPWA
jgi:probable rRNA maturation factor